MDADLDRAPLILWRSAWANTQRWAVMGDEYDGYRVVRVVGSGDGAQSHEAPLPAGIYKVMLEELEALSLRPFTHGVPACDAGTSGVVFRADGVNTELQWDSPPPRNWRSLARWHDRYQQVLDTLLPRHIDVDFHVSRADA
jgi:hypothetical protein